MHVISQGNNVKSIYVQELEGRDHISKNIVIRGIKEESTETPKSIAKVINMHYSMSGVSVYGAHWARKQGVSHSRKGLLYAQYLTIQKGDHIIE